MKARLLLASLFFFALGCDQATKSVVAASLPRGGIEVVPGFFRLVYAQNPGVAFSGFVSLPDAYRAPLLSLLAAVMIAFLVRLMLRAPKGALMMRAGYALVLAGAVGNLIDRVRQGYVVDFILWHVRDYYWPVFNIADVAIFIGVGLLLLARPKPLPEADSFPA